MLNPKSACAPSRARKADMARASRRERVLTATAVFISRDRCIACSSADLREVAGGRFGDEPLRSFIESDPWGENPMPVLEKERWSLVECGQCAQRFHRFILSPHWNEIRFSRWMSEDVVALSAFAAVCAKAIVVVVERIAA